MKDTPKRKIIWLGRALSKTSGQKGHNHGRAIDGYSANIIAALPNQDLRLLWFRDSEGNLLGIMEERKK